MGGAPRAPLPLAALNLGAYPAGTRPPEFSGRTLGDQPVSLAGLRGRVVLLNFWATWCLECRPGMPAFERAVALAIGPREWDSAAAEAIIESLLADSPGRPPVP